MDLRLMTTIRQAAADNSQTRCDFMNTAYQRYSGVLKSFLMRTVEEAEAEDLLHEVYLRLIRCHGLSLIDNVQAFMFTTATNLLRDRWRRANARFAPTLVNFEDCNLTAGAADPSEVVDWQERLDRVRKAMDELPPKPKLAFELSRMHDRSYSEIALELDVSVSMIEKHISTALSQLRAAI